MSLAAVQSSRFSCHRCTSVDRVHRDPKSYLLHSCQAGLASTLPETPILLAFSCAWVIKVSFLDCPVPPLRTNPPERQGLHQKACKTLLIGRERQCFIKTVGLIVKCLVKGFRGRMRAHCRSQF